MWLYAHIQRNDVRDQNRKFERMKVLCSFIDPERARKVFQDSEHIESEGFDADILSIDPNINLDEYNEIMESM
jgi:hypothetical protein